MYFRRLSLLTSKKKGRLSLFCLQAHRLILRSIILARKDSQGPSVLNDVVIYLVQGLIHELKPFPDELRRRNADSRLLGETDEPKANKQIDHDIRIPDAGGSELAMARAQRDPVVKAFVRTGRS